MIVYGERLRPWLERRLGDSLPPGTQFLGRVKDGVPVVVVGFTQYYGDDVEVNLAADPGSGTRGFINIVFAYVWGQLGCTRCTAFIREDNAKSMNLALRMGFQLEGRKRKAKAGHDVLMFGLLREDYGKVTKTPEAH